jgi:predicted RNA binding protein YcfA (HicA-like mRNA interferase family)
MSDKMPRINSVQVSSILQHHGFVLLTQQGSHQKWHNFESGKQVIVPYHQAKHLPIGTLNSIIEGSGISESEFR